MSFLLKTLVYLVSFSFEKFTQTSSVSWVLKNATQQTKYTEVMSNCNVLNTEVRTSYKIYKGNCKLLSSGQNKLSY